MNNEIKFKDFENNKKHYKVFNYDLIIEFDDEEVSKKPYYTTIMLYDGFKIENFKTENAAIKWAIKVAKKKIAKEKRKDKRERPTRIAYNNKRAKWESEYQAYLDEQDRIIIEEEDDK